jgi:hypothetical protein
VPGQNGEIRSTIFESITIVGVLKSFKTELSGVLLSQKAIFPQGMDTRPTPCNQHGPIVAVTKLNGPDRVVGMLVVLVFEARSLLTLFVGEPRDGCPGCRVKRGGRQ